MMKIATNSEKGRKKEIFEITIDDDDGKVRVLKSGNPDENLTKKTNRPFKEEEGDIVVGEGDDLLVHEKGVVLLTRMKGNRIKTFTLNFKGEIDKRC